MKSIIKDIHAGVDMEILKKRFSELIKDVSATEVAQMEQSLIDEGLPEEEVKRLCDVHVEVFKHSLDRQDPILAPAGHPVHTFMVENRAAENILKDIDAVLEKIGKSRDSETLAPFWEELGTLLAKISLIENHYLRKENQLFPRLEAKGASGPSSVMWAIHDDIRDATKSARTQIADKNSAAINTMDYVATAIRDMIYKEEHILFPMSYDTLTLEDWIQVKNGEKEIGYSWTEPMVDWNPVPVEPAPETKGSPDEIDLTVGLLTPKQIDLMLRSLPVDITFVDQNDRVVYYSQGKERIFPRSPGIIGREVKRCHPPRSLHVVEEIVESFKDGTRDEAEFWMQMGGKFIHIRYFVLRDDNGEYQGVIEVTQNVTDIKKLEGEKRLLDK